MGNEETYFDKGTIKQFSEANEKSKATFKLDKVTHWIPLPERTVIKRDCSKTEPTVISEPKVNFLYMDVGRWGGSGTPNHFPRQRDFGVVCGKVALLCTFTGYSFVSGSVQADLSEITDDEIKNNNDFRNCRTLLDFLSQNKDLGAVKVTKALSIKTQLALPKNDTIHVILGDLHLPIITDPTKTYVRDDIHSTNIPSGDAYRMGRLMLRREKVTEIINLLKDIVSQSKQDWVTIVVRGVAGLTLILPATAVYAAGKISALMDILSDISKEASITTWPDKRIMKEQDAKQWFNYYHGENGNGGADVFENAAADLNSFLEMLIDYNSQRIGNPVKLTQVGDLFDFWIGLGIPMVMTSRRREDVLVPSCEISSDGNGKLIIRLNTSLINPPPSYMMMPPPMKNEILEWTLEYTGAQSEFTNFWLDATKTTTESNIQKLIKTLLNSGPKLGTTLLAGNHDNYLFFDYGKKPNLPYFADTAGRAGFEGLFIEHGLPSDKFNNHPKFPVGWLLTQAAFVDPSVREIEETLGRLLSPEGSRLQRIKGAVNQCLKNNCGIYVMGHTHEPFLIEVQVNSAYKQTCEVTPFMDALEEDTSKFLNEMFSTGLR